LFSPFCLVGAGEINVPRGIGELLIDVHAEALVRIATPLSGI
jgi:hypothetical protein